MAEPPYEHVGVFSRVGVFYTFSYFPHGTSGAKITRSGGQPMKTVRQILAEKHKAPSTIESRRSMLEALRLMVETDVGAVMVVDGGTLVGVVSERDYARGVAEDGLTPDTPVADVMSVSVVAVTAEHTVEQCMALMMQKHFRHLPVLDRGTLVGVVTVRDVVGATLDEKEYRIDQLENYISGR